MNKILFSSFVIVFLTLVSCSEQNIDQNPQQNLPQNIDQNLQQNPPQNLQKQSQGQKCDPSYPEVCIPPPPPRLYCKDIPYKNFRVLPPDPHRFDRDKDGIACEKKK